MKTILKFIIAVLIGASIIGVASAQVAPNYWNKIGGNLYPLGNIPSTTIGTSTAVGQFKTLTDANGNKYVTSTSGGGGSSTTTINGVTGPTFTISIVSTSSPSSVTTSSANVLLNLLSYSSSSQITVSPTGTILFGSNNVSQFTNNVPYLTSSTGVTSITGTAGQVSASASTGAVTLSLPQNVNTTSSPTFGGLVVGAEADFGSSTVVIASATAPIGYSDYLAYINALCASGTANGSSSIVQMPQLNVNASTTLVENGRCWVRGTGPGTIINWTGAQGTFALQTAWAATPHASGGGFTDFAVNYTGSSTTTNPTVGLMAGSSTNNGGAHGIFQNLTFSGFGVPVEAGSGTYQATFNNIVMRSNGACMWFMTSNNSGESDSADQIWCSDVSGNPTQSMWFQTSSVENFRGGMISVDNAQLESGCGNIGKIDDLENENSGGAKGAYVPTVFDNCSLNSWEISTLQAHNDGVQTSTSFTAIVSVDSHVKIDNIVVGKQASASSTSMVITNTAGSSGNEDLAVYGITNAANSGSAYTQVFGGAANNQFPTSTIQGAFYQYRNNYAYGWFETSNNNIWYNWNGNGVVMISAIPAGGNSGNVMSSIGGGLALGQVPSSTFQVFATNSSTLMVGASGKTSCNENSTPGGFVYQYGTTTAQNASGTNYMISTTTKPTWCL